MSEIKNCPFCDKQPKFKTIPNTIDGYPTYECCITMSMPTIERLDKEWNTRHIPEGYQLVPIEPTRRMIDCFGFDYTIFHGIDRQRGKEAYKAMLKAAGDQDEN